MRNTIITYCLLVLVSTSLTAGDAIEGTFSSLDHNSASDDLVGIEVRIVWSYKGYYIFMQCSGDPPFVVPLKKEAEKLVFNVPLRNDNFCPSGKYEGHIKGKMLHLKHATIKEFEYSLPMKIGGYWDNINAL